MLTCRPCFPNRSPRSRSDAIGRGGTKATGGLDVCPGRAVARRGDGRGHRESGCAGTSEDGRSINQLMRSPVDRMCRLPEQCDTHLHRTGPTPLDQSLSVPEERVAEESRQGFRDTKFSAQLRLFYLDGNNSNRHRERGLDAQVRAGFETGYFHHLVAFAMGHTSQPLYAPDDKDGTRLPGPGRRDTPCSASSTAGSYSPMR